MVNDPYPGECRHYVDENHNGLCDLSEPALIASGEIAPLATPTRAPDRDPAAPTVQTACPYGLVNDPYPGECRHYVDANGNGICDLSEPALIASGEIAPLPADGSFDGEYSGGQRRGGGGGQGGGQRRGQNGGQ